jgi:hypothetical protein
MGFNSGFKGLKQKLKPLNLAKGTRKAGSYGS